MKPTSPQISKHEVLDRYFLEHRAKLIDIAAFLDRLDRAEGAEDFRAAAFRDALAKLAGANRAREILTVLSDPSTEPIDQATTQGASGAHDLGDS
ncbi:MAG: hypothetical protein AAGB51_09075 [Planctomycetota bacterium]